MKQLPDLRALATFAFLAMGGVSLWNTQMTLDVTFWNIVNPRLVPDRTDLADEAGQDWRPAGGALIT